MCSTPTLTNEQRQGYEKAFNDRNIFFMDPFVVFTYFPPQKDYDLALARHFPQRFDRWVILAFYTACAVKNPPESSDMKVVSATREYLERVAINMKYRYINLLWRRLLKYVFSFGKVKLFERADLWTFFFDSSLFRKSFWHSIRGMVRDGLIIQEDRQENGEKITTYRPSFGLVLKLNSIVD